MLSWLPVVLLAQRTQLARCRPTAAAITYLTPAVAQHAVTALVHPRLPLIAQQQDHVQRSNSPAITASPPAHLQQLESQRFPMAAAQQLAQGRQDQAPGGFCQGHAAHASALPSAGVFLAGPRGRPGACRGGPPTSTWTGAIPSSLACLGGHANSSWWLNGVKAAGPEGNSTAGGRCWVCCWSPGAARSPSLAAADKAFVARLQPLVCRPKTAGPQAQA